MSAAFVALVSAAPLGAQSTATSATGQAATPPASSAPTPTPAPAPSGNAVGPPQLRDFTLNGTVTQPAAPAAPAPAVTARPRASTAPKSSTPVPAVTQTPSAASGSARALRTPRMVPQRPDPLPDRAIVDAPAVTVEPIKPEPSFAPAPAADTPVLPSPSPAPGSPWPWLAALLAVALGAAFVWWRRQQDGAARYAADADDLGGLVTATGAGPAIAPRTPAPEPFTRRAPSPAAARAPSPSAAPGTPSAPPVPAPAAPAPFPGGIVASGLKPRIEFELVPIEAETDTAEGATLTFDLHVLNRGSAPARDVLVEAQLINAGPHVDAEVGRFFLQPASGAERVPMIGPMARVALRMRLAVPASAIAPLVIEGRKLLVPVIAINAFYRWSGGELKDSSSFLVGRGDGEAEKLAPFRLDLGARRWSGLSARLHSNGLQP